MSFIRNDLENALSDMEILAKAHGIAPFEVYLMGGSGCILARYIDRATRDFDIVDLEYSASLGRVLKVLEPYDMIDPQMAILSSTYKSRSTRLAQFEYLQIYVLAREDIIISKLGRLNQRDIDDIKTMLPESDMELVVRLAEEVVANNLSTKAKTVFCKNLSVLLEDCHVQNHVQQLEELCRRFRQ